MLADYGRMRKSERRPRASIKNRAHDTNHVALAAAGLVAAGAVAPGAQTVAPHDTFYFIGEINKASIVMLAETGSSRDRSPAASPAASAPRSTVRPRPARRALAALMK
jgi:hypothetical protein